jgi:hypothetical protein
MHKRIGSVKASGAVEALRRPECSEDQEPFQTFGRAQAGASFLFDNDARGQVENGLLRAASNSVIRFS